MALTCLVSFYKSGFRQENRFLGSNLIKEGARIAFVRTLCTKRFAYSSRQRFRDLVKSNVNFENARTPAELARASDQNKKSVYPESE